MCNHLLKSSKEKIKNQNHQEEFGNAKWVYQNPEIEGQKTQFEKKEDKRTDNAIYKTQNSLKTGGDLLKGERFLLQYAFLPLNN